MGIKNIKFEHRYGIEWVGWQQPNGDTTTDYVSQVMAGPDWELFRPAYEAWQADLAAIEDDKPAERGTKDMGTTSTPTFEVRDGEDWVVWTTSHGDTTSDKVARIKERPDEWAVAGPAYEAWKADAKAQKEAKAADEAKAKAEAKADAKAKTEIEPDDDDDDDGKAESKAGAAKMRAPFKGYKK